MKRGHIIAILLAGVLTVSMLAGCSSQPGATQGDAAGDTLQDTLADTGQEVWRLRREKEQQLLMQYRQMC